MKAGQEKEQVKGLPQMKYETNIMLASVIF